MKIKLCILMLLLSQLAFAPSMITIQVAEPPAINPYKELMTAVVFVESSGDTLAYNPIEQAYGPMQIRPCRLLDYNIRTGKRYSMRDCFHPAVSQEIFLYYASQIGPYNIEKIARNWNGSGVKTIEYWNKVKALL